MARWRTGRPEFRAACSCRALRGWGFECILLDREGRLKSDQEKKVFHRPDKFSENRVCHGFLLLFALRVWQCWKLRPRDQLRCPFLCALPLHAQAEGFVSSVYILKWVLHDWSYERCGLILKNLHEAVASLSLEPGWPQGP
eukprot:g14080.t1